MSYSRNGAIGGGGSGGSEIAGSGAAGLVTLWTSTTTITGDPSGTWSGTGHTFVIGSPTFNARDGHFTGPAGASFGPSAVGGGFTNQPAGDTIDLVSDDAGDTTQQVTIIGTLAGVDASENIMLNGIVPVTSVGTYDLILALVLNGACVGTVTASETSGGLAITTIAPAALSAGLQTFAAIDGYGKVLQIVASGATTKTVGIGGYALGGGIQREPVVLTGTTKVNTTNTWEGAVQFYLGDLEATRTVTLNSIAGFDFKSVAGVFEPVEAGSLAASNLTPGQVLLASAATGSTGATSITGDSGCTWTGTGPSLRIFIGNNAPSSDDANILLGRSATNPLATGGSHGVRDENTYSSAAPGGYASYDSIPTMSGAGAHNHFHTFQSRPIFAGTNGIGAIRGLTFQLNGTWTGAVGQAAGVYMADSAGTGTLTLQAALLVDELTKGAANYAIYSQGANTPSYHAGFFQTGAAITAAGQLKGVNFGSDVAQNSLTVGERSGTIGYFNTYLGYAAGNAATDTAQKNTLVGVRAGFSNVNGSGSVHLGYNAGYYETGSDSFYLNNINQADTAGDKAYSLLYGTFAGTAGTVTGNRLKVNGIVGIQGYTVATLPAGTVGDTAYVTDATAPAFGVTLVGGGAVTIGAFFDGTNWIAK